jgi:putative transposase
MIISMRVKASIRPKFNAATDSKYNYPIAPNLLNRNFSNLIKNQVWLSDMTYPETSNG